MIDSYYYYIRQRGFDLNLVMTMPKHGEYLSYQFCWSNILALKQSGWFARFHLLKNAIALGNAQTLLGEYLSYQLLSNILTSDWTTVRFPKYYHGCVDFLIAERPELVLVVKYSKTDEAW